LAEKHLELSEKSTMPKEMSDMFVELRWEENKKR
jgi:hypothetical protein